MLKMEINVDDDLVAGIDDYAEQMGIDRDTAINLLCKLQIEQYQYKYYDDDGNEVKHDR